MYEENNLGYIKYVGRDVEDGLLDVRKVTDTLMGIDKMLALSHDSIKSSLKGHRYGYARALSLNEGYYTLSVLK